MIKKIFLGVGSVAVVTVVGIVIATNLGVKADTEVTREEYNELVSRIENLETKLEETNNKITSLEEKVTNQEKVINEYETKINNANTSLSSVIKKTDNFEKWQDKFFEEFQYYEGGTYGRGFSGPFWNLENFRRTLQ